MLRPVGNECSDNRAESAIENAKQALIHDHINHCLEETLKLSGAKGRAALKDFRLIAKYL